MSNFCTNIALVLGLASTAGVLYVVSSKHWKQNSQVSSQNTLRGIQSYQGLWVRCTSPEQGTFICDQYNVSFLDLEPILQALRAMMCLACIASFIGLITGLMSMQCVSVLDGSPWKACVGRSGGCFMILAGLLCLASVSWYAIDVNNDFQFTASLPQFNQTFVYEWGIALWIGWVAGILSVTSGILFFCGNCTSSSDDYGPSRYSAPSYESKATRNRPTDYV